jgi:hypothetical protein
MSAFRSGDPQITLLIKQVRPTSGMACYGLISMMEIIFKCKSRVDSGPRHMAGGVPHKN